MQRVLPDGVDVPSAFETVGHIAHFNLREEQLPFRHVIGAVCLDKNPAIKTVVRKVGEIESEFRVFEMELLAGALPLSARSECCENARDLLLRVSFLSNPFVVSVPICTHPLAHVPLRLYCLLT